MSGAVITRTVYGWVLQALQPLLRRKLKRRGVDEPGYLEAVDERFGHYTHPSAAQTGVAYVWVHAVSLGETRAAEPLIQALRQLHPQVHLLLTHGTATGRAAGATLLSPADHQCWLPLDTPGATRRFLQRHRPALGQPHVPLGRAR